MKRNYLLTLLCLLVAVLMPNEVWAECFYVSNGTGQKSTNSSGTLIYKTDAFENKAGISKIEFTAKKDVSLNTTGISQVTLKYSLDGGTTWKDKGTYAITNGNGSSHSIPCSSSEEISKANAFQVLTNGGTWGSYKYIISNFNVYVQSSLSVNPQEVDFGSVPVGQSEIRDVEFTYSNIGTIISSNAVAPYSVDYEVIDECPIGGVGKVVAHIKYQPTEEKVSDNTTIKFTANGQSASITATASASAVVNPTHTWKGEDNYKVGGVLNLNQLWTSNSTGTIAFTITSFNADKENEEGAAVPVITDGNSIVLSQAGKLVIELSQEATTGYNALTSTQTIQISKNTGTLSHNLTNAYHIDDAVNIVDCYTASNSEVEVQVASSNTNVIAVVEGQLKAVGVGTATVTFKQAETYKWTELTASQEITVTKYDLSASISQSAATWDATINNPFAISYDLNDYMVEALDPAIATYTDGAIQTYAETGTAHFVISRAEDYKYNKLAETLSISVAPAQESCYVLEDNTQYTVGDNSDNKNGVNFEWEGAAAKLSVLVHRQGAGYGGFTISAYYGDGTKTTIKNLSRNEIPTSFGDTPIEVDIPAGVNKVNLAADGVLNKYFTNLKITRAPYFSPSETNKTIESTIGRNATGTIQVQYSSCGGTVKVVSDNPKITVSPTSFNAEGSGTQEITLTGDATVLGTETATITIYDQSKKTTINVTSTINRIPQTIAWQSGFENLDVFSTVALDAKASATTEVTYSIAEEDQAKATIVDNVLSFNEAGTVRVVATAAQSDIYETASDTVSVVVSLAQPVVSVLPTVEARAYGTALTDAMLQGGVAKYGESAVEGSFAWADEQITDGLTPNTYSFNVRFTPKDAAHYSTANCTVEVTVNKADPVVSQWPAATLTYGETLAGVVLAGESAYKGAFRWGDTITTAHLDAVKTAGVYTYQVKFVPDNSEQFNTVYGEATITIEEAKQEITWENYPSMCNVGDQIPLAAVASSRLSVEYSIDQNGNYATIDPETNILTALAQGTITLEVNQRGEEGKYRAAEPMRLSIEILPKQATGTNPVTEQEQADIRKVMRNGVLYIQRDGQYYDTCGRRVSIE